MKDYTVENPVFSEKISIVEEEDLVSAENDTAAAKQLIQNDLVLSKRMKQCLGDAPEHGDSKDLVVTFESGDEESADGWTDVPVMQNVEDHKTIFRKISNMVKNVRYLYNLLGTTDISGCGADTVTGAIKKLSERKIPNVTRSASVTQEGQLALDAVEKNAAVPGTMAYDLAQINSKLNTINNIPITLAVENIKNYGVSTANVQCMTYGHICLINFQFGLKSNLGAWEARKVATGVPIPRGSDIAYSCCPVISDGSGGVQVTVDYNGNLFVNGQARAATVNWAMGTLVYYIP